jgi:ribosome assembly protein RRB1
MPRRSDANKKKKKKKKRRGPTLSVVEDEPVDEESNDTRLSESRDQTRTWASVVRDPAPSNKIDGNAKRVKDDGAGLEGMQGSDSDEELVYEDLHGDEYESDGEVVVNEDEDGDAKDMEQSEEIAKLTEKVEVWRPSKHTLKEGEVLDFENSAYQMLHRMRLEWPALSFDCVSRPDAGICKTFPMSGYFVAGTQAESAKENKLMVLRVSNLCKTINDSDDEDGMDEEEDQDQDGDPLLEHRYVRHRGGVNRVRAMPQNNTTVASWSDSGRVHIWDLSDHVRVLEGPLPVGMKPPAFNMPPVFTCSQHSCEGFALDWSPLAQRSLVSGDCASVIHAWQPTQSGSWQIRSHTEYCRRV